MKKIVLLYFLTLLVCIFVGVTAALVSCYSKWYLILFTLPISLGWLPLSMMFKNIQQHLVGTTALIFLSFLALVVALIFGAMEIDDKSFFGIVYGASCLVALIETVVIMLRIHSFWVAKSL